MKVLVGTLTQPDPLLFAVFLNMFGSAGVDELCFVGHVEVGVKAAVDIVNEGEGGVMALGEMEWIGVQSWSQD